MKAPPPDFVILGAPKCGTTSVYATLRGHKQLFLPAMKEPHYFAVDSPDRLIESRRDYRRLFHGAKPGQLRGECSVRYLHSREAVSRILEARPDAKFIALVRNPVEMFVSWHNEQLKKLSEDDGSLENAWRKQAARARGIDIPKLCKDPGTLQYKEMCSLGAQIDRLFRLVPASRRHVIVYDDLKQEPQKVFRDIVGFLGVADDGTSRFANENSFARFGNTAVARLVQRMLITGTLRWARVKFQPALSRHGIRPLRWLVNRSLEPTKKPQLSHSFHQELWSAFAPDVALLSRLLNRDFSHWEDAADVETANASSRVE
jgi:hypothetical protein